MIWYVLVAYFVITTIVHILMDEYRKTDSGRRLRAIRIVMFVVIGLSLTPWPWVIHHGESSLTKSINAENWCEDHAGDSLEVNSCIVGYVHNLKGQYHTPLPPVPAPSSQPVPPPQP